MITGLSIALLPVDPPGLSSFESYDAESLSLIAAINDALVHIDEEGALQPSLATSWQRVSPVEMDFELRQGVRFHNGEPFDADSVVATFHAHRHPTPSILGSGVLAIIKDVRKLDAYSVRVETHVPDVMLLRRLFWGQIYPRGVLEREGRDAFGRHPIGTGAYRFSGYDRGREVRLERNRDHHANAASIDIIRLPIYRQKEWLDRLASGDVDVAWNLDSHDRLRAERLPGICAASRPAAVSQWFLLAKHGPLVDPRVRRALNHAINRRVMVDLVEHGLGEPQRSIATPGQPSYAEMDPFRYSPELARRLLEEAGCGGGFALRGLVSDASAAAYFAVREFLSRVNVTLEAEIVPRAHWFQRVLGGKLHGHPYEGDFAALSVDNPLFHPLFHAFSFLASSSPASLMHDPGYDEHFLAALTALEDPDAAYQRLERYAHDQALLLFTVQQQVHAAWREGVNVVLPRSGHFDAASFWRLTVAASYTGSRGVAVRPRTEAPEPDLSTLLEATSYTDTFFMRADAKLEGAATRRIWNNVVESEQRWRLQNEPMLREIVSLVEARTNLSNVLESTERVAIVGYSTEGRRLFANKGYDQMFGPADTRTTMDFLGDDGPRGWAAIRATVAVKGSWLGPVAVSPEGRPVGAPVEFFLNVTPARDEDSVIGHTFVFSDFSGEEERIRHAAIRTILDNLPYGLFVTDREGRMQPGYSEACREIFSGAKGYALEGRKLTELLGLSRRDADRFDCAYEQIIDDILPAGVLLSQLPERVRMGERTFSLRGSLVRDKVGALSGVLFTLLDISDLSHAEREARRQRSLVKVLQYRDSFEGFVRELDATLARFVAGPESGLDPIAVRNTLHTAKGVLLQFELSDEAEHIHHLEDAERIGVEPLRALRAELRQLLDQNRSVWRIDPDDSEQSYEVTESFLREFEQGAAAARDVGQLSELVRRSVAQLREKPAIQLLGPVASAASQLAERRGKQVQLTVDGGDVRIPACHIPVLATIVHLIRNAIDHGIEPPEQRGDKPRVAMLRINVSREPGALRVEVADDGQGIDTERLARRAVELGLIDAGAPNAMSEAEKLRLVLLPGLSTAESVSETSGRGVGAGAVCEAVEAAGGALSVQSERGRGTTFGLVLPLQGSLPGSGDGPRSALRSRVPEPGRLHMKR
jgi:ABC-type transport system substrate-binding protein/signal transduction histidine kinase